MKTGKRILIISGIIIGIGRLCGAQEAWSPVSAGPLVTWTAPLCEKGALGVQPYFFYNHTRGTFGSKGGYTPLPSGDSKAQYQQLLFAQYGLTDKWEIAGQTIYQENSIEQGGRSAHAAGFGDSNLFLRRCMLEEEGSRPGLTGIFQLKIPTGKFEHADENKLGADLMGAGTGGGSWDPGIGLIASKTLKPFLIHADLAYNVPMEVKVDGVDTLYGRYLNYDFGVEWIISKGWNLMVETNGVLQGNRKEEGHTITNSGVNSLLMTPAFGWSNEKIQTLIGYQRVVAGTNTDANDSLVLTAIFSF